MPEEHAPLGKSYILGFDQGNLAFPIIGISLDPRKGGYVLPAVGDPHPDTTAYPAHTFLKVTTTSSDQRVLWEYRILAGPITTSVVIDPATKAVTTTARNTVATGSISPFVSGLIVSDGVVAIDANTQERTKETLALPSSWEELSTLGVTYHEHFLSFTYIEGLGTKSLFRPAKNRSVLLRSVFTMTNGEQSAPTTLWNPALASWRMWLGFSADNVFSDGGTYSGSKDGVSFSESYPASVPTSTAYLALVAADTEVLYNWESRRFKGDVYANKAGYIPLL